MNVIVLNPNIFRPELGEHFSYDGKSYAEVLAHEAGHNSAAAFFHTESGTGEYEYADKGLQSNTKGFIFPTEENTIGILNDPSNRKNMLII